MTKQSLVQDRDRAMINALIAALDATGRNAPSERDVRTKAENMAQVYDYEGPLDYVIDQVLTSVTTRMRPGVSLIRPNDKHSEKWPEARTIDWTYSEAYSQYLADHQWTVQMRQSLGKVSMALLRLLHDPLQSGLWDRRGLVIGEVQSGKTANYLGLIARAADAGYKVIIVIAGIHNVLRSQTQQRVNEGFVGLDPVTKAPIGVGLNADYPHPKTLTNLDSDFNSRTAKITYWKLRAEDRPLVLVIKKNVSTLESLLGWLRDLNAPDGGRIMSVPMLMIDDEADHASINTNKPETDPTRTNALIRDLLRLFARSCYVGYTATPFANIFINPDIYAGGSYDDLYPKDFVYCLSSPSNYFGPDTVFLRDQDSRTVTVPIADCEEQLPVQHKQDHYLRRLPDSLIRAINQFIVARAIRNLRGQAGQHCSMMINVSRFTCIQDRVRDLVYEYTQKVKEAIQVNYAMPDENSGQNPYMRDLRHTLEQDYAACGIGWSRVKGALHDAAKPIQIVLINGPSPDRLEFDKYAAGGRGLSVIAVGGLSLSRGLTLEGLCVSYVYRNTRMYDTLMQMGRWFGYRTGYQDLCRVHLSQDAIDWYGHIAEITQELVGQVHAMRAQGKTPKDLGMYVESHPDRLMITSPRKMLLGEKMTLRECYGGRIVEFSQMSTSRALHGRNESLIREVWGTWDLYSAVKPSETRSGNTSKGWVAHSVPAGVVKQFLERFEVHRLAENRKEGVLKYLAAVAHKYPYCDVLLISLRDAEHSRTPLMLGAQTRTMNRPTDPEFPTDFVELPKQRVASRGDEGLGLTLEQWEEAEAYRQQRGGESGLIDADFRNARGRPLLMVHVLINRKDPDEQRMRMPTIGMSFPTDDFVTRVEVVANPIWAKLQREGVHGLSDPDGEDE